jgi:hypothetical protein
MTKDSGKSRPQGGATQRKVKWGFIPAAAGKKPKHHPMTDMDGDGTLGLNVTDRGKDNLHGHNYPGRPYPKNK